MSAFIFQILITCIMHQSRAQAQSQSQSQNISKMYGEAGVTTNYVDRGLTQSEKAPSVRAGLGYWFGTQGRIGFEAHSVNYADENSQVELRAIGEFKFSFSATSDLRIRNDLIRYFADERRNRVQITLDQNFSGYHILASREDNFEGTDRLRDWFALHRDWPLGSSYQFNTTIGYSVPVGYEAYFDTRLGVSYLTDNLTISLFNTWVSKPDQFSERGDTTFLLTILARF